MDVEGAVRIDVNRLLPEGLRSDWQVISRDVLGSSTLFTDIYQDRQQNVWLGSFGDGIYRASRGKIKRVVGSDQPDDVVRSVAAAPNGELLLALQQGLGFLTRDNVYLIYLL